MPFSFPSQMTTFVSRLSRRIEEYGPLCLGIDPSIDSLTRCGLPNTAQGAFDFGRVLLDAARYEIAIAKPQVAYFERFGSAGILALEELALLARNENVLMLIDAKRGDIDTTGEAYGEAFFSSSSPLKVDAVTLNPFLGFESLRKLLDFAVRNDGGAFIVVRSSNPEGEELQTARLRNGTTIAEDLCQKITTFNLSLDLETLGPIGAVLGATCDDAAAIAEALPQSFLLAPGIGAQGATLETLSLRLAGARGRVIPSVSRAVLFDGCGPVELQTSILRFRERALELLWRVA